MNESIYYIVDDIHNAIANNRRIRFEYMRWNLFNKMELRREIPYEVSSWAQREGWSATSVDVALSDQFFGWIFSLGTKVKIIEPEEVAVRFADEMRTVGGLYETR